MTSHSRSSHTQIPYANRTLRSQTAVVHLEYNPAVLEPVPSPEEWTRFVCISDTHSRNFDVPSGDVLLHSGDLTKKGRKEEFVQTMEWLYALPHKVKM
jgi:3',5'-cyclic AMP phosphodiesterase CpdA